MFRVRLSAISRITIGLTGLLVSLLFVLALLGLFPDRREDIVQLRTGISETAAIGFSLLADKHDAVAMQRYLESITARNPDIVSIGVRRDDGELLVTAGDHDSHWNNSREEVSLSTQVGVQLYGSDKPWGTVEFCFAPLREARVGTHYLPPAALHGGVLVILCLLVFRFYLRAVLTQLDPAKVVPKRVREALDTLAEGLLVLDGGEHIVLANRAFQEATGMHLDSLTGISISRLPLTQASEETRAAPWSEVASTGKPVVGRLFGMSQQAQDEVTFSVSASPIVDEQGQHRGVLASFENVTLLERKKRELGVMVEHLRVSSSVLKQQNRELKRLATRDALTDLLNRRPFFDRLDAEWKSSARYGYALSAVMIDVDHFKSVNDRWGHAVGDEVLRRVATSLKESARETDVVCRYGGEEFLVLMPHTDLPDAARGAERLRGAIEHLDFGNFSVTVSLGVSSTCGEPRDSQELLRQADTCLYVAKRAGRNRVVRWDEVPPGLAVDESTGRPLDTFDETQLTFIPFHAVSALISALAYRDQTTAAHSRRVADLCFATAEGLLSFSACYVLEMAALLHDIGKIGVPDDVLLKPGPLAPDEWELMRRNATIGAEIVRASFASPELSTIVETYRTPYAGSEPRPGLPTADKIPLGARILAIADAYDSMVTDRVYRKARTSQEACDELRRCAGTQFDPELVERFISVVSERKTPTRTSTDGVSPEMALSIGLQIERLLIALDAHDLGALAAICGRVKTTAEKYGADAIATKASELGSVLELDGGPHDLVTAAFGLLDLCRSTQVAFLGKTDAAAHEDPSARISDENPLPA